MRYFFSRSGFTFVEVLISGAVFTFLIIGVLLLAQKVIDSSLEARLFLQASELAQEGVGIVAEIESGTGFTSFTNSFPVGSYHLVQTSSSPWFSLVSGGEEGPMNMHGSGATVGFTRHIELSENIPNRIWKVKSSVFYGMGKSVERTLLLTQP